MAPRLREVTLPEITAPRVAIISGTRIGRSLPQDKQHHAYPLYSMFSSVHSVFSVLSAARAHSATGAGGVAVAISGDIAIVGALGNDDAGDFSGTAYIFERNQGGADNWGEVLKLTASDAAAGDRFGNSVAIASDGAIVSAWRNGDAGSESGSPYIFARNEGGPENWGEVIKLTASDAAAADRFGGSVAIFDDSAIVGASSNNDAGTGSGSAYIFVAQATCGNGVVEPSEECDDGNLNGGDGCSATCAVEPGSTCTGEPSVCIAAVPAVSEWGLAVLTLLLLVVGTLFATTRSSTS